MNINDIISILQAYGDGVTVEKRISQMAWMEFRPPLSELMVSLARSEEWRVKPASKKRLIRADELPPTLWVRQKDEVNPHWWLAIEISIFALIGHSRHLAFDESTLQSFVYSIDRKEIRSFFVEDEA